MTVVATGGYGRGLLAPYSDIDLLFLLPYKQTPWGESVVEYMLYLLWDLGLKVGHATRTVEQMPEAVARRHDHPHHAARCPLILGDKRLFAELIQRFQREVVQGTARAFVEAKLAERDERHRAGRRIALSRRAQHQGRQGRPARPAHAALAGQISLRQGPERGRGGGVGDLHTGGAPHLPPLRGLPVDRPLPSAFPVRPRRGAADLRRAAGDGRAPRLRRARRPARGRALHEALLPGGQGGRRSHHHPLLGAGDGAAQGLAGPDASISIR